LAFLVGFLTIKIVVLKIMWFCFPFKFRKIKKILFPKNFPIFFVCQKSHCSLFWWGHTVFFFFLNQFLWYSLKWQINQKKNFQPNLAIPSIPDMKVKRKKKIILLYFLGLHTRTDPCFSYQFCDVAKVAIIHNKKT
jgi:hypothetical protein